MICFSISYLYMLDINVTDSHNHFSPAANPLSEVSEDLVCYQLEESKMTTVLRILLLCSEIKTNLWPFQVYLWSVRTLKDYFIMKMHLNLSKIKYKKLPWRRKNPVFSIPKSTTINSWYLFLSPLFSLAAEGVCVCTYRLTCFNIFFQSLANVVAWKCF